MPAAASTAAPDLTIVPPDRRKHAEALCDLVAKVFSGNGYYTFRNICRKGYILNSHYDWQASRIGLVGERPVTHFGVWGMTMRIGTARVRVGGIGAVATDADFRKRGLMARTARAAVAAMRECGYDLSLLFGISDFYHRFGYIRAFSPSAYTVAVADLPGERPTVRPRKFNPLPRADTARLYNRASAGLTGTAVRPTFTHLTWPHPMEGRLWRDGRRRLAGYVVFEVREGRLMCGEACGNAEQVLRVLAVLARQRGCQEVRFDTFHRQSPLIRRICRGNCRVEPWHRRSGGEMVATIHLGSALTKMRGELERRMRASPLADWRGRLLVADSRDAVTLALERTRVSVTAGRQSRHAIRGGDAVAQLVMGTDDPAETIAAARMRTTGDAARLAKVLFPNEHPMLGLLDRF